MEKHSLHYYKTSSSMIYTHNNYVRHVENSGGESSRNTACEIIVCFCRGHSQFVQLMKEFAYSLVAGALCPLAGGGQPLSYTRTSFYMEAVKLPPASLSGRIFTSSPGDNRADYIQFPEEVISVPAPVSMLDLASSPGIEEKNWKGKCNKN